MLILFEDYIILVFSSVTLVVILWFHAFVVPRCYDSVLLWCHNFVICWNQIIFGDISVLISTPSHLIYSYHVLDSPYL